MNFSQKCVVLLLLTMAGLQAKGKLPSPCYLLELSSIGLPTAEKTKDARPIHDLIFFNDKLYIGYGDAVVNTGPTDIIYYDPAAKEFTTEFTIDEEALYYYQLINDKLMIPGIDATEEWNYGNFYILEDTGWVKYRTLPNALHVNYLAWFHNKLYASTGALAKMGENIEFAVGCIFCSSDTGKTWTLSYSTPGDENRVYRINALIVYKNRLFAFPYAYSGLGKKDIPEKYHNGLSEKPMSEGYYLILNDDLFGIYDVLVSDGKTWRCEDIIPEEKVCYTSRLFIFKDRLLIPTLSGEYIDYLSRKKKIPPQASYTLWSYDGKNSKRVKLNFDRLLDVLVKEELLYLLIERDGLYYIAKTENLKKWEYFLIPPATAAPKSIELKDTTFYIGTEDGNIFKTTARKPIKTLKDAEDFMPKRIFGVAELPEDGKWYWVAITDWQVPDKLARFSAEVKFGNIIKISTDNVAGLKIFLPFCHLNPEYEFMLIINNKVVYEGSLDDIKELICERKEKDDEIIWEVKQNHETSEETE